MGVLGRPCLSYIGGNFLGGQDKYSMESMVIIVSVRAEFNNGLAMVVLRVAQAVQALRRVGLAERIGLDESPKHRVVQLSFHVDEAYAVELLVTGIPLSRCRRIEAGRDRRRQDAPQVAQSLRVRVPR